VGGVTTIDGTLSASNSANFTIKGNWMNNGIFTHNTGTVVVDFSSISNQGSLSISGTATPQTFHNLNASASAAGKTLKFKSASTFIFAGTVTLTGSASSTLDIASTTPTSQWIATLSGTSVLNFLTVIDSGCSGGNNWTINDSVANLGNNGVCWSFI